MREYKYRADGFEPGEQVRGCETLWGFGLVSGLGLFHEGRVVGRLHRVEVGHWRRIGVSGLGGGIDGVRGVPGVVRGLAVGCRRIRCRGGKNTHAMNRWELHVFSD